MKINFTRFSLDTWLPILFIFTLAVYTSGISVTLMEPDATVYADIAMEMAKNNNYHEINLKGQDWLDKPHFQFWITSLSYKFFGINNFGYKFPAILFSLIAIYYTFLFGRRFYSMRHGFIAAIILMTAEHFILSNNDVRAEPFLAMLSIFSIYYFANFLDNKKLIYLIIGSFGLAGLLMTKGMFTILPVASGIGLSLLYEKKWKEILHWQWIILISLTLFFISPTLIAYYMQFDMHPEKEIFGQTGVSGIKFFLWDSQWGRFMNTGPIKGEGDTFFFIHTMLWSFAPWALLAFSGIFVKIKDLIYARSKTEKYTIFGFLFTFIIFSLSSFQLPHYLNQLFPFMAIICSDVLLTNIKKYRFLRIHYYLQFFTITLLLLLIFLLQIFFFDDLPKIDVIAVLFISLFFTFFIIVKEKTLVKKILIAPALIILAANYYMNRQFYPALLHYQSESEVAFYMKENKLPVEDLVSFEKKQWSTDFYLEIIIPEYNESDLSQIKLTGKLVYTTQEGLNILSKYGYSTEPLKSFEDFHVTGLNGEFINKKTRKNTLSKTFLVYVQ